MGYEIPKPDYDDIDEPSSNNNKLPSRLLRPFQSSRGKDKAAKESKKGKLIAVFENIN